MLGDEHLEIAITLCWIAKVKKASGAHFEAEKLYHQGLDMKRKMLETGHVQIAHSLHSFGLFYA